MTIAFYHNDEQKNLILKTRDQEAARRKQRILTEVMPVTEFTVAEDYHQKYQLRQVQELMKEFRAMYPDDKAFAASTAAARVNGYISGFGREADLERDISRLGLSAQGQELVRRLYKRNKQ
jgi:peptide-methionine (S)-S-oxide reductase